jgi:hypothetical protein
MGYGLVEWWISWVVWAVWLVSLNGSASARLHCAIIAVHYHAKKTNDTYFHTHIPNASA